MMLKQLKYNTELDLNSPQRFSVIRLILQKKPALKNIYLEVYQKYIDCIGRSPKGSTLEIGSGAGFCKEIIPEMITSDMVAYPNIDLIMDATNMKACNNSLACICLFNVLHHISNIPAFFKEAIRTLMKGGRIYMLEPYPGWISYWIYQYIHHEGFDMTVPHWEFQSKGPVSDANNALPYIIFERDIKKFQNDFPELSLIKYQPTLPLRYWLTGGLKKWSLLPGWLYSAAHWLDKKLIQISPRFGSFVEIELLKK